MLLNPQAVKVLEFINSVKYVPTIEEIGSATGLSSSTVWRVLKGLRNVGIGFKTVADLGKLGLVEVLLVYRTRISSSRVPRKLLRTFIRTLEGTSFLKYVTRINEVESTVNYVVTSIDQEPSEVYIIDSVVPPKYVLTHIARGTLDRLYPRELLVLASAHLSLGRPQAIGQADPVDIALINKLEEDALTKIKDVYRDMKERGSAPSYQTVLKHYREHIVERGVIAGIRPTFENRIEQLYSVTRKLLVLYGTPSLLVKGVKAVVGIPAFMEAYLNTKEGIAYTLSVLPLGLLPKVVDFLGILESRGFIREWIILETEPASLLKNPIPETLGSMSVSELLTKPTVSDSLFH